MRADDRSKRHGVKRRASRVARDRAARALAAAALLSCVCTIAPAQQAPALPDVKVIGTTPLPGLGQPLGELPAPVQSTGSADVERSGAIDLTDYMNRALGGVHVNELQGNPFQPDVSYRGYTASPLLGTPQGLSVYFDGVRFNQPFGDIVSWDLVPRMAIASVTLMPGSNPLFGLNTLGGALAIETKDGRRFAGTTARMLAGSYARRSLEIEHGGASASGTDWYLAGRLYRDRGWREESPSDVRQLFAKIGRRGGDGDVRLTVAAADNTLMGNGLQEQGLLAQRYDGIYTKPDITENRSLLLNLTARKDLDANAVASGNLYFRDLSTRTLNADLNQDALDQPVYQPSAADREALASAGFSGFPSSDASAANTPFPFWRCIAQVLQNDEPAEKCNALVNRTSTEQRNWGAGAQLARAGTLAGQRNQLVVGVAWDESRMRFTQTQQLGYLNADRSVTGLPAFADGASGGTVDGVPLDNRIDLQGRTRTASVFASDTWSLGERWHLTGSARYNRTTVANDDRIRPGGGDESLDGRHRFARLNPAIGVTFTPQRSFGAWLGYHESSRAPTAIELGCANPARPCKLPNAMTGDPPLRQVVARTIEAGMRGATPGGIAWSASAFRSENHDDLLFVAGERSGFGYFRNFGRTLRQGIELSLSGRLRTLAFGTHYTLLDATYRSAETVDGSSNSSNSTSSGLGGTIDIRPGHRIPLVPRHLLKAWVDWQAASGLVVGLGMIGNSGVYARGNENNQHQPDGTHYLGTGKTSSWAVFNLNARWRASVHWQLFVQVSNLFDRRYSSAAQLGPTGFTSAGTFVARPFPATAGGEFPLLHSTFLAPGAPRMVWIGVVGSFGP